jgi:DNA-directed RNA polymerase subunit RPC12/RpoP
MRTTSATEAIACPACGGEWSKLPSPQDRPHLRRYTCLECGRTFRMAWPSSTWADPSCAGEVIVSPEPSRSRRPRGTPGSRRPGGAQDIHL